jgi:hypothetical protein
MADVERISVAEARRKAEAGEALLVCAYDDAQKCNQMKLHGSIQLAELRSRLGALPKDQQIIFYCA